MTEERRDTPESSLDALWQMTNPTWGRAEVPKFLRDRLSKRSDGVFLDEDGNQYPANKGGMWELLGFFTRDLRLGFLTNAEAKEAREWLEITSICAAEDLPDSFFLSLSKVISMVEISQSRSGNLRRNQRTRREESSLTYDEPPKRFGKKIER